MTSDKRPGLVDAVDELAAILYASNARVTFDAQRSTGLPCFNCGETERPRVLTRVGVWEWFAGNRGRPGDPIERPVCAACVAMRESSDTVDEGRTTMTTIQVDGIDRKVLHMFSTTRVLIDYDGLFVFADAGLDGWFLSGIPARDGAEKEELKKHTAPVDGTVTVTSTIPDLPEDGTPPAME